MHLPPPPDSRELLPPLLACLPTAFVSPQPPPALLPLLSPLLRQRLSFLSSNDRSRSDGWLSLLSWDAERAAKLGPIVERIDLEPHPVSGEVEMDEVRPAKYRRLDEETLQARLDVEQFELLPIYVWCETDEHGGTGPGWKLAEVRSLEDLEDGTQWYDGVSQANDAAQRSRSLSVPQTSRGGSSQLEPVESMTSQENDEGEDDDYWASYDRTPGRTPAQKRSPAPNANTSSQAGNRQRTQSELDYYARYGHEVQPAMDSHDPDEEHPEAGESTLNGDSLLQSRQPQQPQQSQQSARPISRPNGTSMFPADTPNLTLAPPTNDLEAPRAISPTSSHGSSVERLEERARLMSEQEAPDRAQIAIQQHISTDIKSLFRLARSTGMEREDFERIVKTELECLSFMEQDE